MTGPSLVGVSFSAYTRRVRDPALPYQHRVSALRSCVQLYRPIGFQATLSFLKELAGPFHREEAALLRALDALSVSKDLRRAEFRRYAATRRAAKRRGRRSPHPDEQNPYKRRGHWYGAPREAALHALTLWRSDRPPALLASSDPVAEQVDVCVAACVAAGGSLTPAQRHLLATAVESLHARLRPGLWQDDRAAFFRTRDLLWIAHLVEVAADAAAAETTCTSSWVLTANIRPLVESLAALVDYEADDWDWDAIEAGLNGTDAEDPHGWYDYPLAGTTMLRLELANEPGSNVTMVQVHHPPDQLLTARIETLMSMLARYQVIA